MFIPPHTSCNSHLYSYLKVSLSLFPPPPPPLLLPLLFISPLQAFPLRLLPPEFFSSSPTNKIIFPLFPPQILGSPLQNSHLPTPSSILLLLLLLPINPPPPTSPPPFSPSHLPSLLHAHLTHLPPPQHRGKKYKSAELERKQKINVNTRPGVS